MSSKKQKKQRNIPVNNSNNRIYAIILFIISFILYANTLGHEYVLDDFSLIKENRFTQAGIKGIGNILTKDMFAGHIENYQADLAGGRYRPLSQITFALEYEIFGLNPAVSHFVNIVLFGLTPVLILLTLSQLLKITNHNYNEWYKSIPFLAALIFAVHPIHTEAVANIKGRDEIMAMLLVLTSFYYFIKFIDLENKKNLYVSIAVYFLALLSKENAITYMAVFPLSLMMFRYKKLKESFIQILPFIAVTVLFIIIRQSIVGSPKDLDVPELMNEPFAGMTFIEKYTTIFSTLLYYLKLLIIPYPLTYDYYPYHVEKQHLMSLDFWYSIIAYCLMIFYGFKYFKSNKIISFSIFYYIITLSIVSNLLFTIGSFMNERFVYMPSLGISMVFAYLISEYIPNRFTKKEFSYGIILIIVGAYSFMTISRNPVWKDNYTLMTTDAETSTNSAFGNFAAGGQYYIKMQETNDPNEKKILAEKSKKLLYKSLEIYPRYSNAAISLGNLYFAYDKNVDSTIKYYTLSYEIYPYNYETVINLGRLWRDSKKDLNMAEFYFKHCIKVNPNKFDSYNELGVVYFNAGKMADAALMFENALARNPNYKQILNNLYAVYNALGEKEKAQMYLSRANMLK